MKSFLIILKNQQFYKNIVKKSAMNTFPLECTVSIKVRPSCDLGLIV